MAGKENLHSNSGRHKWGKPRWGREDPFRPASVQNDTPCHVVLYSQENEDAMFVVKRGEILVT